MQTADFETLAAKLRNLDDQVTAADAALQGLFHAQTLPSNITICALPSHVVVAVSDDEDGAHSVPAHYILHALRQWQHDARAAKIEAQKQLEGLG